MNFKRLLTVAEFSAAYGVRKTKAYQLLRTGSLKALKSGVQTLITSESAENWATSLPTFESKARAAAAPTVEAT